MKPTKLNRAERRRMGRTTGKEGEWVCHPSPKVLQRGDGWSREFDTVYSNGKYAVMTRPIQNQWGNMLHICMRNISSTDIPWKEKHRIKNELFGEERIAVEVFPKESELIDAAMMYHLWLLPEGMALPFGID